MKLNNESSPLVDNDSIIKCESQGIQPFGETTQQVAEEYSTQQSRSLSIPKIEKVPSYILEDAGIHFNPTENINYLWNGGGESFVLNGTWSNALTSNIPSGKIREEIENFSRDLYKLGNKFWIGAVLKVKDRQFFACSRHTVKDKGDFSLFATSVNENCRPIASGDEKFARDLQANNILRYNTSEFIELSKKVMSNEK